MEDVVMSRIPCALALSAGALCCIASLAVAQDTTSSAPATPVSAAPPLQAAAPRSHGPSFYHFSIGVGGGWVVPVGTNQTLPISTGFNGQVYVLIKLLSALPALRFNVGLTHYNLKHAFDSTLGGIGGTTGSINKNQQVLSGVGGIQLTLFHVGPVRPYVTGGLGAFQIRTNLDSATGTPGTTTGRTQSSINFGVDYGGGLALVFGRVSAFTEARAENVFTSDNNGKIKNNHIQSVPIAFGLTVGLF
jgi:opacity protein-like surface antigen